MRTYNLNWLLFGTFLAIIVAMAGMRFQRGYAFLALGFMVLVVAMLIKKIYLFWIFCALIWLPLYPNFNPMGIPLFSRANFSEMMFMGMGIPFVLYKIFQIKHLSKTLMVELNWPLVFFILGGIIANFSSANPTENWSYFRQICLYGVVICLVCNLAVKNIADARIATQFILVGWTLFVIFLIAVCETGVSWEDVSYITRGSRLAGKFLMPWGEFIEIGPVGLGSIMAYLIPIAYCFWLHSTSRIETLFSFVITGILSFALIWTNARGAIIGSFIGILIVSLMVVIVRVVSIRSMVFKTVVFISLIVPVFIWRMFTSSDIANRIIELRNPLQIETLASRIDLWIDVGRLWLGTHGVGLGFSGLYLIANKFEHNFYLYLLNGVGLLGFISFCIYVFKWVKRCLLSVSSSNYRDQRALCAGFLGMILAIIISGMVSEMMTYGVDTVTIWLLLGIGAIASKPIIGHYDLQKSTKRNFFMTIIRNNRKDMTIESTGGYK